jgi:hypothetical protein
MIKLARHTVTAHAHYTSVSRAAHTTRIFAHTRSRITLTHHAKRSRITFTHPAYALRLRQISQVIPPQRTHVTQAHQTSTHNTHIRKQADELRSRITLTHRVHASLSRNAFTHLLQASRLRSTFMIKPSRHTLPTHAHYKRVRRAPHTTRIFAHTRRRIKLKHRVHATRSRLAFMHHVHASRSSSRLLSSFKIKLVRPTLTAHAHYTSVSNAPHTNRIFAHTRRRITLTHRCHTSR